jgi:hypothetical protein
MLSQEDENGDKHPIAYASKTLNSAQINYSTSDITLSLASVSTR